MHSLAKFHTRQMNYADDLTDTFLKSKSKRQRINSEKSADIEINICDCFKLIKIVNIQ